MGGRHDDAPPLKKIIIIKEKEKEKEKGKGKGGRHDDAPF